ncbi:MAG: Coenzyme F420 hydrogenase/dehydrogenase, beta subunit C-terminal domain [Mesotoga sp.]
MVICPEDLCTGCGVCAEVCPTHCISLVDDSEGFRRPIIDASKCTDCGLCRDHCPANHDFHFSKRLEQPEVYAAKAHNKDILKESSSGGVFSVLAKYVIDREGSVFGCVLDDHLNPIHVEATAEEEVAAMRGSKYVQSDPGDTFRKAKTLLQDGKHVLYSGTPCQIAGLNSFLGKDYDNLLTVDLICHGVPSNLFFHEYLRWLEKKLKCTISEYRFRDKRRMGWGSYGSMQYEKLQKTKTFTRWLTANNDYYFHYFYLRGDNYRESCYRCKYAKASREGDFTLGDYWGIQKHHPEIAAKDGVSLVLVNTEKAKRALSDISKSLDLVSSKLEYAIENNRNLVAPMARPQTRNTIYKDLTQKGFERVSRENIKLKRFVPWIKRKIPIRVKNKIKMLLKRN